MKRVVVYHMAPPVLVVLIFYQIAVFMSS
jgi:hypothetical protein